MPTKGNIMANANAGNVRVAGQGDIYIAPAGTALPTDSTTAYSAAYVKLGFVTDGFQIVPNLKTQTIPAWQTTEPVLLINQSRSNVVTFEAIESNKQVLSMAFGGGSTVNNVGVAAGGAVTIGTAGLITTATAHGRAVGDPVILTGVATSTGILSNIVYYVITVGSATTVNLSATKGGVALTTTAGTATGMAPAGAFSITTLDSAIATEYVMGLDWQHSGYSARYASARVALPDLPTIKFGNDDAVRFPLSLQVLKPFDGSQSFIQLGNDVAALS